MWTNTAGFLWFGTWVPVVPGSGVANHLAMALEEQYIKDPVEKDQLFDAIHTMPAVRDKARWLGRIWKSHEVCVAKGGLNNYWGDHQISIHFNRIFDYKPLGYHHDLGNLHICEEEI